MKELGKEETKQFNYGSNKKNVLKTFIDKHTKSPPINGTTMTFTSNDFLQSSHQWKVISVYLENVLCDHYIIRKRILGTMIIVIPARCILQFQQKNLTAYLVLRRKLEVVDSLIFFSSVEAA